MHLLHHLHAFRWRLRSRARRARTALAYYLDHLTQDQAYDLLHAAENRLGVWSLVSIDAEGVHERVRDTYHDHPCLRELAHDAAARVAHKWSDDGETRSAAIDWAEDLVSQYAEDRGVTLIPLEADEP
jgi:hypothetical protein